MRARSHRRPELILLAALIVLALVMLLRALNPPPAPGPAAPAPAPRELGNEGPIAALRERLRQSPADSAAAAALGLALLQRSREIGDPGLYAQAEQAFGAALEHDPQQIDAILGSGLLALARHDFRAALAWGERARALNPFGAPAYGIIGDAHIELGQYDQAVAAIQHMVDTRPDLGSYSRVAYLRELYGDVAGAIQAMEQAVEAGSPGSEQTAWTTVQLGHLHFGRGDLDRAAGAYADALAQRPGYHYAEAGLAQVAAASGDRAAAIAAYEQLVQRLPLPEFVIALGELYLQAGRPADAAAQFDLVGAMQQLNAAAGIDTDLELARFEADHGDPQAALAMARAAYERRPSIYAADALAWALYRSGDHAAARSYSAEALRLGTQDALLHYHAGMIASAAGDAPAARRLLDQALAINPYFSPPRAAEARATLAALSP